MEKIKEGEGAEVIVLETKIEDAPLIDYAQMLKLMEFQGMSFPALARACGTPVSTLRKLMHGQTPDPRISSILPVVRALGASLDRLIGLAPKRDIAKEEAVFDASLMDSMRWQLDASEKQRAELQAELAALREQLDSKIEECGRSDARAAALDLVIKAKDDSIARRDRSIIKLDAEVDEMANRIENQSLRLEAKAKIIQEQAETISRQAALLEARDTDVRDLELASAKKSAALRALSIALCALGLISAAVIVLMGLDITTLSH